MTDSIVRLFKSFIGSQQRDIYGLDHTVLNVTVPPATLWMNLGYWKDTTSFPAACQALLDKVLSTAGLLNQLEEKEEEELSTQSKKKNANIRLIDVGFGCGDQSLYLTRNLHRKNEPGRPLFDSYLGINITASQVEVARKRLFTASSNDADKSSCLSTPKVDVFAADAANPASWDCEIWEALGVDNNNNNNNNNNNTNTDDRQDRKPAAAATTTIQQTWLLALDTLYHFKPSRLPLFAAAYGDLHASIMAFDLLLSDSASLWDKLYLRLLCLVAGMPYSNFMTATEYRALLTRAGYDDDDDEAVEMQDVSEHVFAGIAGFVRDKELELGQYGMTVGKFKGPARVFDWWARSGVVRGYVIVARR